MTDSKRNHAAREVRQLVTEYDDHPFDINNGQCEEFANDLIKRINDGAEVVDLGLDFGHFCVKYNGFYFDAEEPNGAKYWQHLPLCTRKSREYLNEK